MVIPCSCTFRRDCSSSSSDMMFTRFDHGQQIVICHSMTVKYTPGPLSQLCQQVVICQSMTVKYTPGPLSQHCQQVVIFESMTVKYTPGPLSQHCQQVVICHSMTVNNNSSQLVFCLLHLITEFYTSKTTLDIIS